MTSSKTRTTVRIVAAAIVLLIIAALIWWRTAAFRVDPEHLDYLRAYPQGAAIVLIGAWDAPGGTVLDGARFRRNAGDCIVSLFGRPLINTRGDMNRIFRVTVPVSVAATPGRVLIEGPSGTASIVIADTPAPAQSALRPVEMTAEPEAP